MSETLTRPKRPVGSPPQAGRERPRSRIIQICGTSGSGKSHLMRSFKTWLEKQNIDVEDQLVEGRKSPMAYRCMTRKQFGHNCLIMGAYDVPTGGCDTIRDVSQAFSWIKTFHGEGCHLLFEGLFMMNQTRGPQLAAEVGKDFAILQLTTPLAVCLASINSRRAERGEGELANKNNTVGNYRRAENYCLRMRDAGARVYRVSRDEGLDKILELLGG